MPPTTSLFEKTLVFLYFLLLPSQTSYHFWLTESILYGRQIDYLSPTIYTTHLLAIGLLFYWHFPKPSLKINFSSVKTKPLIVYILITINILFAQVPAISVYRFITIFITAIFFFNLSRRYKLNSPIILVPLSMSVVWTAFLTWTQWIKQSSVGGIFTLLGERPLMLSEVATAKVSLGNYGLILRPYATLPHPNALAGYLLVSALLLVFGIMYHDKSKLKYIYIIAFYLASFSLPLTFSRSAALSLISLPLVYLWKTSHQRLKFKIIVTIPLLILTILINFIPANPNSLNERFAQYSHAITLIQKNPLFGVGIGNYLYYSPASLLQLAHNTWLLLYSEFGVISIFILVLIYSHSKYQLKGAPYFVLLWPLLITSFVDSYWYTLHQTFSLAVFALFYAQKKAVKKSNSIINP